MSLVDAPMALLDRILARQAPTVQADDPIARMIARTTGRLRPDRYYQRRLRSRVVNQFVAMREGLLPVPPPQGHMGRVGRTVLYASVGMAISVAAVGAASTGALPGDPLYAVKLEVEQVRMDIAPASVKPDLAELALEERLSEVERLAQAGRWDQVAAATPQVAAAEVTLRHFGRSLAAAEVARLSRHHGTIVRLLHGAPTAAVSKLERVLAATSDYSVLSTSATTGQGPSGGANDGAAGNGANGGNGSAGRQVGGAKNGTVATPRPSAKPHPSPEAGEPDQTAGSVTAIPSPANPLPTPRPTSSPHTSQQQGADQHN